MKLTVIEVTQDGKVGYLAAISIFHNPIVATPLEATNYATEENAGRLEQDLSDLHLKGDYIYGRSCVRVDTAHVVELELSVQESSRREARPVHTAPDPR